MHIARACERSNWISNLRCVVAGAGGLAVSVGATQDGGIQHQLCNLARK